MLRKDDLPFKKVVDGAMSDVYKSVRKWPICTRSGS